MNEQPTINPRHAAADAQTSLPAPASNAPRLTKKTLQRWINQYRSTHDGRFPSSDSGPIDGEQITWRHVESWLRAGTHGVTEPTSLSRWIEAHYPGMRPRRRGDTPNITREQLLGWIESHRAAHNGAYPTRDDGRIGDTAWTWASVDQLLDTGAGWIGGKTTLARWIAQHVRGEEAVTGDVTPAMVRRWIDAFRASHDGRFPTRNDGKIDGVAMTWSTLHALMYKGMRNFGEKITLRLWLEREYEDFSRPRRSRVKVVPPPRPSIDAIRDEALALAERLAEQARAERGPNARPKKRGRRSRVQLERERERAALLARDQSAATPDSDAPKKPAVRSQAHIDAIRERVRLRREQEALAGVDGAAPAEDAQAGGIPAVAEAGTPESARASQADVVSTSVSG